MSPMSARNLSTKIMRRPPAPLRALALFAAALAVLAGCGETEPATVAPEAAEPTAVAAPPAQPTEAAPDAPATRFDPMALPTAGPAPSPIAVPDAVPEDLAAAWEVWKLLTERHVDRAEFDRPEFDEGAIRGILSVLGDSHTNYVSPERFEIENEDLYGSFQGIGARVDMRPDGKLIIVSPMEGSPAMEAGLRPGDTILAVDGESIAGLSISEAVNKIRGPQGSTVLLLVKHLGDAGEVEIAVRRDVIPLESVLVRSSPEDRFAHIRLTAFFSDTPEKLAEAIEEQMANGVEGLILDVRNNPGGLLSSVVEVTSMFIDGGLILYEVDGAGNRRDHGSSQSGEFTDIPLVLLANQYSASASEILVGALQDHARADIVGATTFGKGSVNRLHRLSNGGGLFLTFAKWYTPSGKLIEGNGVAPDYEVTHRDAQKADTAQFEKAVEVMESIVSVGGR